MSAPAVDLLLAEGQPADAELILLSLAEHVAETQVHVAQDGEEALDFLFCRGSHAARRFDSPPRVVLLGVNLPKVDGLEVLSELKRDPRTRAIPVVLLTSSRQEQDMAVAYRLGVNSYVQKPVDFLQFRETMKRLALFWLQVDQAPPTSAFRGNSP